jgi:drug/metabolite transporter (DMT)-like permease
VIVALLSAFWLREAPGRRQWTGIGVAMLGALVVAAPELLETGVAARRAALGNLLAVVGAVTAAIYFVTGRRLRGTLDLWPYVGLVYGTCFVALVGLSFATGVELGHQPPREVGIFVALALGPMMLGHTGLNWALRYLPAYVVNLTLLGEPVGATIIAALLPGIREVPHAATLVGGALILLGVLAASRKAPER